MTLYRAACRDDLGSWARRTALEHGPTMTLLSLVFGAGVYLLLGLESAVFAIAGLFFGWFVAGLAQNLHDIASDVAARRGRL